MRILLKGTTSELALNRGFPVCCRWEFYLEFYSQAYALYDETKIPNKIFRCSKMGRRESLNFRREGVKCA